MTTGPRAADDPEDSPRRPERRRPPLSAPAPSWRWGELSGARGTLIVIAVALVGAIATVAAKRDPGPLLGWLIVAGTLIAAFAVRPRSAYLLVPVPALAYVVFGLAAGFIHNQSEPSTALTVNAAQWIANGFLTMAAATVLAVVVALGRWLLDRRAAGRRGAGDRAEDRAGDRAGDEERRGPEGRRGRGESGPRGQSGLVGESGPRGPSGQSGRTSWGGGGGRGDESDWPGRSDGSGRDGRGGRDGRDGREGAPGRPRPAFYPNPDWSGDRGQARDRRPPPGPPSFGASRDLDRWTWPGAS